MKRSWFHSVLSRISNRREAAGKAEMTQILQEMLRASTSEDPSAKEKALARLKDFVGRHPERIDEIRALDANKMDALRWAREILVLGDGEVDLSHVARDLRKRTGWPLTGSVRDLEGGDSVTKFAIEEIERHGGKLTLWEASRIVAALDPESSEAASYRWQEKKRKK